MSFLKLDTLGLLTISIQDPDAQPLSLNIHVILTNQHGIKPTSHSS